jgi:hypothetical protein
MWVSEDIPILPGHYRRTMWNFLRSWLGMLAGIGVFGFGIHWQSIIMQIMGGVLAFAAFCWMFTTIGQAQSACCPSCSAKMTQGRDEKRRSSDGIFRCPQCQSQWRTKAIWGFD